MRLVVGPTLWLSSSNLPSHCSSFSIHYKQTKKSTPKLETSTSSARMSSTPPTTKIPPIIPFLHHDVVIGHCCETSSLERSFEFQILVPQMNLYSSIAQSRTFHTAHQESLVRVSTCHCLSGCPREVDGRLRLRYNTIIPPNKVAAPQLLFLPTGQSTMSATISPILFKIKAQAPPHPIFCCHPRRFNVRILLPSRR